MQLLINQLQELIQVEIYYYLFGRHYFRAFGNNIFLLHILKRRGRKEPGMGQYAFRIGYVQPKNCETRARLYLCRIRDQGRPRADA